MTNISNRIVTTQAENIGVVGFFLVIARRWLVWLGNIIRGRIITYGIVAVVAICGVALRTLGLGRSLWLDEAWVANSAIAEPFSQMFYYDAWLQTSPPLFLLLARLTVDVFGLSNSVLRIVPSLMGLFSAVIMVLLAARLLAQRYAILASTLFALSPIAVYWSRTLKQYSSELAATTTILLFVIIYLEGATLRRFWLLTGMVVIGLLIAYPVAFLLPGIALIVYFFPTCPDSSLADSNRTRIQSSVRAIVFTTLASGILIGEYLLFVLPNTSPLLRAYWSTHNGASSFAQLMVDDGYGLLRYLPLPDLVLRRTKFVTVAVGFLLIIGFALACVNFRKKIRIWLAIQVISAMPCLLLFIADWFHWYPMEGRTGLFLLPFVVVLVVCSMQLTSDFLLTRTRPQRLKPLLDVALVSVTVLVIGAGIHSSRIYEIWQPGEDVGGAVSYLRENVHSHDILWVHASVSEGFKLYTRMVGWTNAPSQFGNTGWPCRPVPNMKGTSTEIAVRNDLGRGIPDSFSGRVWLLLHGTDRSLATCGAG